MCSPLMNEITSVGWNTSRVQYWLIKMTHCKVYSKIFGNMYTRGYKDILPAKQTTFAGNENKF